MELARTVTLVTATLTTGLVAGLFYAFSCAVMPGLRRADDTTFVTAMRAINRAILNGWFALGFFGALLSTVATAALHAIDDQRAQLGWILAALVLYLVMLAITGRISVPLNDRLDAGPDRTDADRAARRMHFEATWNRWNLIRTLASTSALASLVVAALLH